MPDINPKVSVKRGGQHTKILIAAPFHSPSGPLGSYVKEAFTKMGYHVKTFDYRIVAYGFRGSNHIPTGFVKRGLLRILRNRLIQQMNIKLIDDIKTFNPDIVLILKGEIIFPETIKKLKEISNNAKIVVWHLDSPFTVLTSTANIINSLPYYDVCFVFDPYYIPEMVRARAKRAEYLPLACDPDVHRSMDLTDEEKEIYGSDICFIGNYAGINSRRDVILSDLTDFDLKIWGNNWHKAKTINLERCVVGKPVYGDEMVKIYNASKICINVHHDQSIIGVNMRTFEVPACGGFLLTDRLPELPEFFELGQEVVCYEDVSDLRNKIKYYLNNAEEREEIAKRGQQKAQKEHTYVHRMEELIKILNEE